MSEQTTIDTPDLEAATDEPSEQAEKSPKKPKKDKPLGTLPNGSYAFLVDGERHVLPKVTEELMGAVPGSAIMDAYMAGDPDQADMISKFGLLKAAAATAPEAVAAIRSLSFKEMNDHLNTWLGESSGSSD